MQYLYDNADWCLRRYEEAKTLRAPYEEEWRRAARYCLPGHVGLWQTFGNPQGTNASTGNPPDVSATHDSTAKLAIPKFSAICHRLATPKSQIWHRLTASNPDLMKQRAVALYFDSLNSVLWKRRYDPKARFSSAQTESYVGMGAYGNGIKFISQRRKTPLSPRSGLHYRSVPLQDLFVLVDEEGNIDTVFRSIWLTARQAGQKFDKERLPSRIRMELDKAVPSEANKFEFVQVVMPREDWNAERMDAKRWPLASVYISVEGRCLVEDPGGYNSWPYIVARHFTNPGGIYGVGPASLAREALGSANAIKKTLLKQGQKAVDPTLLAFDDGITNGSFDLRAGAINYGGVNAQGQKLIQALEPGSFQWGENLLTDERNHIDDAFLVRLFQVLIDTPEMTATEVMERIGEKAAIAAPTMERLQSEDLGPTIEREIDVLDQLDMLPEMPPELIEAKGEYEVIYTSPLAKSQNAEAISGFMRIVDMATGAAQATGNSKPLRRINFDAALPEIAETLSVPARWMHSDDEVEALADGDAQAQGVEQLATAAPAIAGVMKAAGTLGQPTKQ